jgi:hypothetical protein
MDRKRRQILLGFIQCLAIFDTTFKPVDALFIEDGKAVVGIKSAGLEVPQLLGSDRNGRARRRRI